MLNTGFTEHKLSLNISKTKSMNLGTAQRLRGLEPLNVKLGYESVKSVSRFKYLVVMTDCKPKFDDCVAYLRCKIYTRLEAFGTIPVY